MKDRPQALGAAAVSWGAEDGCTLGMTMTGSRSGFLFGFFFFLHSACFLAYRVPLHPHHRAEVVIILQTKDQRLLDLHEV